MQANGCDIEAPLISKFINTFLSHKTIFYSNSESLDRFINYQYTPILKRHNDFLIDICRFYNIPITKERQQYIWDGKCLDITQRSSFHWQMHEVGHFLLCPLQFRHFIDYGLGPGGSYNAETIRNDISEDIYAGIFGLYLEFMVGDDISITIGNIGVDEILDREFLSECFDYFVKLNIIDRKGNLSFRSL